MTTIMTGEEPDKDKNEKGSPNRDNEEKSQSVEETLHKKDSSDGDKGQQPSADKSQEQSGVFSPENILSMRLPASDLAGPKTRIVRTKIVVDRPPKDQFFKTHPDHRVLFGILEMERNSSKYLVAPGEVRDWMIQKNIKSYFDCDLRLIVTKHGEVRLWPLKQTDNDWHVSAMEIAKIGESSWVKLVSDRSAGYYVAEQATGQGSSPDWPEDEFEAILSKAFTGKIIDSMDHEVVRELRGDD